MRDVLKLALDALESSDVLINGKGNLEWLDWMAHGYYSGCFTVEENNKLLSKAILKRQTSFLRTMLWMKKGRQNKPLEERQHVDSRHAVPAGLD